MLLCGVGIIVGVLLFVLFAVWHGKVTHSSVIVTMVAVGVAAGVVVTNLTDLAGLVVQAGEKGIYGLRVEKVAQQVRTDAEEVRQLKAQVEKLVEQATPRTLSDEQRQSLVAALSPFRGQKIRVGASIGDMEGGQFAIEIVSVLSQAGWTGEQPGTPPSSAWAMYISRYGMWVSVSSADVTGGTVPRSAQVLLDTLVDLDLAERRKFAEDPSLEAGVIEVNVGKKPLPKES